MCMGTGESQEYKQCTFYPKAVELRGRALPTSCFLLKGCMGSVVFTLTPSDCHCCIMTNRSLFHGFINSTPVCQPPLAKTDSRKIGVCLQVHLCPFQQGPWKTAHSI